MRSCVYSVFIGSYVFYLQLYLVVLEDVKVSVSELFNGGHIIV